jgi:hypothetical protein
MYQPRPPFNPQDFIGAKSLNSQISSQATYGSQIMSNIHNGIFQLSLKAIKLQLETLLDDCGGDKAANLLNALAQCSPSMRDKLLTCMIQVVNSVGSGEDTLAAGEMENAIFNQICAEIEEQSELPQQFEVLDGGNHPSAQRDANIIDFSAARKRFN